MTDARVDIVVVGAGPTGLYAAYCAGFRGLSVLVVDSLAELGGQVSALYAEKLIYDVAGLPAIRGRELIDGLAKQADAFSPRYLLGEQARSIARAPSADGGPPRWLLTTDRASRIDCGAIVVTGGIGTFTPRPLAAAAGYRGRGLAYHVPHLDAHRDQDVVVVGGGDSAVDWALALEPIARSVTLVHRRARFRAHAASVDQLRRSRCVVHTDAEVDSIAGDPDLRHVVVATASGARLQLPADALVAALGFTANLGPLTDWGLEVVDRAIVVDSAMRTCLPGVHAAGDIAGYLGKVKLISVGFGEAALAVNNAATYLDPSRSLAPGHSTGKQAA
ncbi:NAD(P)/FAD-dependent oxidoreductase [Amycolatopsis ultiminotia]|uniref:Ferredoxin--NADP reductase n=1 Tax=Amycolatopsis ultiminotia TaxID=543629 RepID=A0ABP6YJL1_9PSEU